MQEHHLTGAQKTGLRGLGQKLSPVLKAGKDGLTAAFFSEFRKALGSHELVKVRFPGADRHERAQWCEKLVREGDCACVGAVGHTALFYRQNPEPKNRRIDLG